MSHLVFIKPLIDLKGLYNIIDCVLKLLIISLKPLKEPKLSKFLLLSKIELLAHDLLLHLWLFMQLLETLLVIKAVREIDFHLLNATAQLAVVPNWLSYLFLSNLHLLPLNIPLIIDSSELNLQILILVPHVLKLWFDIFQLTIQPESLVVPRWPHLELFRLLLFKHLVLLF
jgi:hypothetical protein